MASLYYGRLSCWQSHQKPCRLFNWYVCLRTLTFSLFGCNLVICGGYSACVWLCNSKPGDFLHLRDKGSTQFPLRENVHNLWNISTRDTTELKKWPVSDRHWRAHLPSRVIQQRGSKFLLPKDGPGSPGGLTVKNLSLWETWVLSLGQEDPLEKEMATIFLPGEFHGQRSLAGYSLWGGHQKSDMT